MSQKRRYNCTSCDTPAEFFWPAPTYIKAPLPSNNIHRTFCGTKAAARSQGFANKQVCGGNIYIQTPRRQKPFSSTERGPFLYRRGHVAIAHPQFVAEHQAVAGSMSADELSLGRVRVVDAHVPMSSPSRDTFLIEHVILKGRTKLGVRPHPPCSCPSARGISSP